MSFSFSVKCKATLKTQLSPEDYEEVLGLIADYLSEKSTSKVIIEKNTVSFKADGITKQDVMTIIDRGTFSISDKGDDSVLTYQFFIPLLGLIIALIPAGLITAFEHEIFTAIFFIGFLALSWIITILRHRGMLKEIAEGIDEVM